MLGKILKYDLCLLYTSLNTTLYVRIKYTTHSCNIVADIDKILFF